MKSEAADFSGVKPAFGVEAQRGDTFLYHTQTSAAKWHRSPLQTQVAGDWLETTV